MHQVTCMHDRDEQCFVMRVRGDVEGLNMRN